MDIHAQGSGARAVEERVSRVSAPTSRGTSRRILLAIVAVPVLLVASCFVTVGRSAHYTCVACGMYFQDRVMFGIRLPIHRRGALTEWHDRKLGAPHEHRWGRSSCTAGLNVWQECTHLSCGASDPIVGNADWVAGVLARLEALDLDVSFHAEMTHADVEYRSAAIDAACQCDPAWDDAKILAWWVKAQRFLGDRGAWEKGFREYDPN